MRIVLALLLLAASLLRHGTGGAKYLSAQEAKSEEKERRELYGAEKEARRIIAGRTFDSLPEQALEYNLLKEGLGKAEAASVARYVESLPDRAREANPADIAGTKELEDIVYCPGFANLPNAIEFAKAYVLSTRRYRIAGVRNNGTVDYSDVPGVYIYRLSGNPFSALPLADTEYSRITVDYFPNNDDLLSQLFSDEQDRENWQRAYRQAETKQDPTRAAIVAGNWPRTPHNTNETKVPRNETIKYTKQGGGGWSPKKNASLSWSTAPETGAVVLSISGDGKWTKVAVSPERPGVGTRLWYVDRNGSPPPEFSDFFRLIPLIVHEGDDLPSSVSSAILKAAQSRRIVRKSQRSAARDNKELFQAARLGSRALQPQLTRLFNALPQETGWFSSLREMWRMGLSLDRAADWLRLNDKVQETARSLGVPITVARRQDVLNELSAGNSDVVFVIAHSAEGRMYLPTMDGQQISVADIAELKREAAPNRTVVLITCGGGAVNTADASFAEMMLQNKLAKAVFATPKPVDANIVPQLLERLFTAGSQIRDVLDDNGLPQIVHSFPNRFYLGSRYSQEAP